jgi:hypothetical protein
MNNNLLQSWGAGQRQMPGNAQLLKAKILAEYSVVPKNTSFNFTNLIKYIFPATALLILVVVMSSGQFKSQTANLSINSLNTSSVLDNQNREDAVFEQNTLQQSVASNQPLQAQKSAETSLFSARSNNSPALDTENKRNLNNQNGYAKTNEYSYTEPEITIQPQSNSKIAITDNREFLKTSYSANINSLNVNKTLNSITSLIKSFDGRLDLTSANLDTAQISFVIASSKLETFKEQVKNIAGAKLYIETINSENKLNEKQAIEKKSTNKQQELETLKANLADLSAQHVKTVSNLKSYIQTLKTELSKAQSEVSLNSLNIDLQNKVKSLESKIQYQIQNLNLENENYEYQKELLDYQILGGNKALENIKQQDQDLLNSVATVNAQIIIYKINWLEYINAYLPFYLTLPILFIISIFVFLFKKRTVTL